MITGEGASRLLKAMTRHANVRVLDLSWNTIGSFKSKLFATDLAEVLRTQDSLIHLDISNNIIKGEDCQIISAALSSNHTLWGIHMLGNDASVDSKGYLHIGDFLLKHLGYGSAHLSRRIQGVSMVVPYSDIEISKMKFGCNCWICEGWREVLLQCPSVESEEPVYLCLECDGYEPDLMEPDQSGEHRLYRMLPPGLAHFFFIREGKTFLSPSHPKMRKSLIKKIKHEDEMYPIVEVQLEQMNCVDIHPNSTLIRETYEPDVENCIPRPIPGIFRRPQAKKNRVPWSIPISLFRDYQPDNDIILKRCFEEDWRHMGKPKMPPEKLEQCKQVLSENYSLFKDSYRYYAAIGRTDSLFAINKLILTDFIAHKIFLYDGDKLTDMDLVFMTIKGRPKEGKFQPKTALTRFEFLELFFRLALKKYYETKEVESEVEALDKMIQENMKKHCSGFSTQSFRSERYWNEECDNLLKSHQALIDNVYDCNSGSKRLPGEKPFMCFDEFIDIFANANLLTEEFTEREAVTSFALSMMTQIDELDSDRHMKMAKLEYYEALARAAEVLSLPPKGEELEEWTQERREAQPLADKLDNLTPYLLTLSKKEFRERFRKPERDPEALLYYLPGESALNNSFFH